jgi:hypothetical protein
MHLAILIVSVLGMAACGITASVLNAEMVDQLNEKLPKGAHFPPAIWYHAKTRALHREYQKLIPERRLVLQQRVVTAVWAACLLAAAYGSGLFSHLP